MSAEMRETAQGRWLARNFARLPGRHRLLKSVVAAEGGPMYSRTLRRVLTEHHGVEVGDYSYGSLLTIGMADSGTTIGRYVSIGPGVRRFGAAHPLDRPSLHPLFYNPALGLVGVDQDVERTPCLIDHESWIGADVVILPGCTRIGVGAAVGAGSVVTRDVPDFAVAVGNPARVVKYRLTEDQRAHLLATRPWEREPSERLGRDELA